MKKKIAEHIAKNIPSFFKTAAGYLKNNFDENGQEILDNSSGTAGLIINLFAKPLIDKYFDNVTKNKLANHGFKTYLKASLLQANLSVEQIEQELSKSFAPEIIFNVLNESIKQEIESISKDEIILIFQPQYHPMVVFIKNSYSKVLSELTTAPNTIKKFQKHYNENIENTIKKEFGTDYETHLIETEKIRFLESESKLLWDTIQQGKIGFKDGEYLKYEPTYAQWKKVHDLRWVDDNVQSDDEYEKEEKSLSKIETLIDSYFNINPLSSLEQILFVIADFGKGKSVFLRHYASELAKQYAETSDGYFPIYFNLRNYKNYSTEQKLGILSDYLQTKYSIKIDDEYFRKKKYMFLIDSLDESGELNKRAIDNVITSIKSIQGIDKTKYKTNRIIVTSRPFDEGLSFHLAEHVPYAKNNMEDREVHYFISIYGFTKEQFNDWLYDTLKIFPELDNINATGFAKQIIDAITKKDKIDIYTELLKSNTLSRSELRRPIFAYMIYQLIINNVDFLAVGKIGVYLSFLNLLTKEAKHIHDVYYQVNLKEEFEFRNILHATSALWMYERQKGRQGTLKKADICRVLEGENKGEDDSTILDRFKGKGLTEIHFLSHSYFGENNNVLHFQHQSFAEILLAEYYLKIFIKYALDEDTDMEEARIKLMLGEPTEQTIHFFKEMLKLLKDTTDDSGSEDIIEKRKLLFPLMASLAIQKHNKLFCHDIYYSWFKKCDIKVNQTEYPKKSLQNWCIDTEKLEKILNLCARILNSSANYIPVQGQLKSPLFNSDILSIQNQSIRNTPQNIDCWLALTVGNTLHNNTSNHNKPILFNTDYKINSEKLFNIIRDWNYTFNDSAPSWGKNLFKGLQMYAGSDRIELSHYDFDGIDFSYSYFNNILCWAGNWSRTKFDYCSFNSVAFITSLFYQSSFHDIVELNHFEMGNCQVSSQVKLLDAFGFRNMDFATRNRRKHLSANKITANDIPKSGYTSTSIYDSMFGLIIYGLKKSMFTLDEVKTWFTYDNKKTKIAFTEAIDRLKIYEVINTEKFKNKA